MKFSKIISLAIFSSAVATSQLQASSIENSIIQVDEIVDGQSVEEYVNTWWQWAFSMPQDISPIKDYTGQHCGVGQQGDVWFLAGGFGTSTINRRCEVPAGKHLFFPVINMVYFPRHEGSQYTCEQAKASAALNNDKLLDIYVELNGEPAWNPASTRMASSDCFDLLGKVSQDHNPPKIYPAATDGYWLMLKPLESGTHTLKFQAGYDREGGAFGRMAQDIEYELIVR